MTVPVPHWPVRLFVLTLLLSGVSMGIGWGQSILGQHAFRQAQTAITAWYLMAGGPFLAYETPVLGAPWSIPFEFPLYQWIVAQASVVTGVGLEGCGRWVSVIFYMVGLASMSGFLREVGVSRNSRAVTGCLVVTSPIYLFWSRAFMIESTAWCFGFLFLFQAMRYLRKGSFSILLATGAFAVIAALVKVTTFLIFALFLVCFLVLEVAGHKRQPESRLRRHKISAIFGVLAAAFSVGYLWVWYSDHLKEQNPLARSFLLSDALVDWNFGTLAQKLDPMTWKFLVMERMTLGLSGFWLLIPAIFVYLHTGRHHARLLAVAAITYGSGFAIFTNLHLVHDYYAYANSAFLVMIAGILVGCSLESPRKTRRDSWWPWLAVIIFSGMVIENCISYRDIYLPGQRRVRAPYAEIAKMLRGKLAPGEIFFVWGQDWNSALAYQAERRSVMERSDRGMADPLWDEIMKSLDPNTIKAGVFCGAGRKLPEFFQPRLRRIGIDEFVVIQAGDCLVAFDQTRFTSLGN